MSSGFLMKNIFFKKNFSKIKIKLIPKGERIGVRKFRKGHTPELTDFDFAIVELDNVFDKLKNKAVSPNKRRKKSCQRLKIFEKKYPSLIKPAIVNITQLANSPSDFSKNSEKRLLYQKSLAEIFKLMKKNLPAEFANSAVLVLERGAILINSFYNSKKNNLIRVIAKRLDYKDGKLGLGLANLSLSKNIKKFKRIHVQEDCIATGDSIGGALLALKEKNIFFEDVLIDVAVATQTGVEFLLAYLRFLGIKKTIIRTGALCFKLDNHFYLKRTKEEGYKGNEYFVGDMGAWSKKLPVKFNKIAWWNKNRLDYEDKK